MDRINFVVQEELEELVGELEGLDPRKARAIYEAGFSNVYLISKARPLDILKALQKTLQMRPSRDATDLFKEGVTEADYQFATLEKAEEIINSAKRVMKRRYLAKAREVVRLRNEAQSKRHAEIAPSRGGFKKRATIS